MTLKTIKELENCTSQWAEGKKDAYKDVLELIDEMRKNADELRIIAIKNKFNLEAAAHRGSERALEELETRIKG